MIDNFYFYFQNRLIQTSQTGGQQYSDTSPFSILCSEPTRLSRPSDDVDGTEIVVIPMSRGSQSRDFWVELNGVHSKNLISDMRHHVVCWKLISPMPEVSSIISAGYPTSAHLISHSLRQTWSSPRCSITKFNLWAVAFSGIVTIVHLVLSMLGNCCAGGWQCAVPNRFGHHQIQVPISIPSNPVPDWLGYWYASSPRPWWCIDLGWCCQEPCCGVIWCRSTEVVEKSPPGHYWSRLMRWPGSTHPFTKWFVGF